MKNQRFIEPSELNKADLTRILNENPNIRFVSVAGVDLMGHETDEKIPRSRFLEDLDTYLEGIAVQTDGSSVFLPGIATLNNGKIDMKADTEVRWWIDDNMDSLRQGERISTLKIPCSLIHNGQLVDSRSILRRGVTHFEESLLDLLKKHPESLAIFQITPSEIDRVHITAATELEFWVKTPEEQRELEELSTSQELKEQYWARTRGDVRTALEKTLIAMEEMGLSPEMGHKEVGGVKSRLTQKGSYHGIMEQLEVDWKYADCLQAADHELVVKQLIKENFRSLGMEVTFLAKPMSGVAGSGEHTHVGVQLKLKNGRRINLFDGGPDNYLSRFGYGALMGILKHYELVSPFVAQSNDAFNRLKKGFEAPICIVTSLGHSTATPSRNRTILLGLIRDPLNPMATRFELRSPNPHSNTYLVLTAMLQTMLDGIRFAITKGKKEEDLYRELSKKPGQEAEYLRKERQYRTEVDVFADYSDEEREEYFGKVPQNVYENISHFETYKENLSVLLDGQVFTEALIDSYQRSILSKWQLETLHRVLPDVEKEVRSMKKHHEKGENPLNDMRWQEIQSLRKKLLLDEMNQLSLTSQLREALEKMDLAKASHLQLEIQAAMGGLRKLYQAYRTNRLD